jgi:hypothetical protein
MDTGYIMANQLHGGLVRMQGPFSNVEDGTESERLYTFRFKE